MHLVLLNQYYPPDAAPTGVMLEAVVRELIKGGHEVTVICGSGGYAGEGEKKVISDQLAVISETEERAIDIGDGNAVGSGQFAAQRIQATILRIGATRFGRGTFFGKLLDYFSYYLGASWKLATLKNGPDRVVALTTPPYLSVLARLISKFRRADHAHWVMDLYPDVMVAHGMLGEGSLKHRFLKKLARWGFGVKRCAAILTLGPDMADRVAFLMKQDANGGDHSGDFKSGEANPVKWAPLWGTSEFFSDSKSDGKELRSQRGWDEDDLIVMYSGNMGLGHRFHEFLKAAKELATVKDGRFRFVFFGEGKRRAEIEAFIGKNPDCAIELHGYAPSEILDAHLRSADVQLVSLEASWTGTMVPSKLQGIFAVNRPVIFVGPADSSIGRWVEESGGGWVVAPNEFDVMVSVIREAADQGIREKKGQAAGNYGRSHFGRAKNSREVAATLSQ